VETEEEHRGEQVVGKRSREDGGDAADEAGIGVAALVLRIDFPTLHQRLLDERAGLGGRAHRLTPVADHLDAVSEGAPLLRQQRSTRSAEGEVIEYHDDRYLPAMVSFTLQNNLDVRCALSRSATTELEHA